MLWTILLVASAWTLASVLLSLLLFPLWESAKRGDRAQQRLDEPFAGGEFAREPASGAWALPGDTSPAAPQGRSAHGIPSPQRLGYAGLVLERLAEHARAVLAVDGVCILVCERGQTEVATVVAGSGLGERFVRHGFSAQSGLAGMALRTGRPVILPAAPGVPGSPESFTPEPFARDEVRTAAAAPLSAPLGPCGALVVGSAEAGPELGLMELELLSEFAGLASRALRHHQQRELVAADSEAEIRALVGALARADGATFRHSLEVAELATRVGRRLGLDRDELLELELAALLHDIGKLRLPAELLVRPGPLSKDEWQLVERHPEWGADIVAGIPGLEAVAMIVRLHHERADGTGYPHELPHERIPKASRIVAVCDAYGAMTAGRPYQESVEPGDAVAELSRHCGTQFDPESVRTLARILEGQSLATA